MKIKFDTSFNLKDYSTGQWQEMQPGEYDAEIIPHPRGILGVNWIVIKGTTVGSAEGYLRTYNSEMLEKAVSVID